MKNIFKGTKQQQALYLGSKQIWQKPPDYFGDPDIPIKSGLALYYDFRNTTNQDIDKDVAFDWSGSGNHGILNGFNYIDDGHIGDELLIIAGRTIATDGPPNNWYTHDGEKTIEYVFTAELYGTGNFVFYFLSGWGERSTNGEPATWVEAFLPSASNSNTRVSVNYFSRMLNHIEPDPHPQLPATFHTTFTQDDTTTTGRLVKSYNGIQLTSQSNNSLWWETGIVSTPFFLGRRVGSTKIDTGRIRLKAVRVYNRKLSEAEIQQNNEYDSIRFNL